MPNILYIGSDNSVLLSGLINNVDSTYQNDATVTMSLYEYTNKTYLDKKDIQDEEGSLGFYATSHGITVNQYFYILGSPDYDGEYQAGATTTEDYLVATGTYSSGTDVSMSGVETVHKAVTGARGLTMTYVADSDGNYRGTIPDTVQLKDQNEYYLIITATAAGGEVAVFRSKYEANYKDA